MFKQKKREINIERHAIVILVYRQEDIHHTDSSTSHWSRQIINYPKQRD